MRRSAGLISISMSSSISGRHEHGREGGVAPVAGIERRLAHQAMHAGLGPQPAVGVLADDADRGALDPGDFAGGGFEELGRKALRLAVLQVHAQQHLGPVLGLRAAGAGLDVDESIPGIVRAAEHALELEALDILAHHIDVAAEPAEGGLVLLRLGQIEQIRRVGEAALDALEVPHQPFELRALAAEQLGPRRVFPDLGVFQCLLYFGQPLALAVEVKDTPGETPTARGGRG